MFQLETVAKCASQLRILSQALDVKDFTLDPTFSSWKQELVCLHVVGLRVDIKESLLDAWGLVLMANNELDTQKSGKIFFSLIQTTFVFYNLRSSDRGKKATQRRKIPNLKKNMQGGNDFKYAKPRLPACAYTGVDCSFNLLRLHRVLSCRTM